MLEASNDEKRRTSKREDMSEMRKVKFRYKVDAPSTKICGRRAKIREKPK
jgi:hypothetical protein